VNWFDRIKEAFTSKRSSKPEANESITKKPEQRPPRNTKKKKSPDASNETASGRKEDTRTPVERLFPREREVFIRLLEGMKMRDIADELNIKTSTVNGYCREVYRKLGVNSKAQLILRYAEFRELKSDR